MAVSLGENRGVGRAVVPPEVQRQNLFPRLFQLLELYSWPSLAPGLFLHFQSREHNLMLRAHIFNSGAIHIVYAPIIRLFSLIYQGWFFFFSYTKIASVKALIIFRLLESVFLSHYLLGGNF